jgi:hypothetical protein
MLNMIDTTNWYWIVGGDSTQVYSSASGTFVPSTDATYLAWLATPGNWLATADTPATLGEYLALSMRLPMDTSVLAGYASAISVTQKQARLALLGAGLLTQVDAAVTAAGGAAQITWEYADVIKRTDSLIVNIGTSLGLTSAQIDALFATASTL